MCGSEREGRGEGGEGKREGEGRGWEGRGWEIGREREGRESVRDGKKCRIERRME